MSKYRDIDLSKARFLKFSAVETLPNQFRLVRRVGYSGREAAYTERRLDLERNISHRLSSLRLCMVMQRIFIS